MSRILVVDDSPDIRQLIRTYLQADGHVARLATDGQSGLEAAMMDLPDLIISDVRMPFMDGFGLLDAVRADRRMANVSFMMMTAYNSPEILAKALRAGVNEFISKPFDRVELMKMVGQALRAQGMLAPPMPAPAAPRAAGRPDVPAAVIFTETCGLEVLNDALRPGEVAELLARFAADSDAAARREGGTFMRLDDRRFAAVFEDSPGSGAGASAAKAMRAALTMVLAAQRLKPWTASRFPGRHVPELAVALGVHCGSVQMLPGAAAGPTVDLAAFLARSSPALRWSIAASREVATAAGLAFLPGRDAKLTMAKRELAAVEVKGLGRREDLSPEMARIAPLVEAAVNRNAGLVGFAQALTRTRGSAPRPDAPAAEAPAGDLVPAYSSIRKLSDNGIVAVSLGQPVRGGAPVVVKTILIGDEKKRPQLKRFVDAYAALADVDHPAVARGMAQGLTATHAYVAQEYCPAGDLRNLIADGMSGDEAMKLLLRVAGGLKAAHQRGVVHGDLEPSNILFRADGSVAITDFSLAIITEYAMGEAGAGVVLRSPDYMSPELINGAAPDMRSDLYSLGLLLHEMLTRQRAYASADLSKVLMDHLTAPVPRLPAPLERYQPLLDKLMAKQRDQRFGTVTEAIQFMMQGHRPG
jgi:serine/threonine-protein kinase PpkA